MAKVIFKFLDNMSDDWLVASRLLKKGDKKSLKKLSQMENTKLVLIDKLKKK